jgi:ATP phosphoribosyltransferase
MGSEAAPIVKPGPVAIHLALPKGHMQENVFKLFEDAGIKVLRPSMYSDQCDIDHTGEQRRRLV